MWKQTLGENPFASVLNGMQGPGQHGVEQWLQQVAPYLQTWQQSGKGLLGLPTFGFTREHQQRWQQMAQAQLDHQEHSQAYQALMAEAGKKAFERFEAKLAEHSEPGRQLGTARALFDLWIDAAEEAYAEIALSPKFREVYGQFVNSQMRVRAALQQEIEEMCGLFGIPGRTEIDAAHRKIAQMERELRRLRDAVEHGLEPKAAAPRPSPRSSADARKPEPAKPPGAKRAAPGEVVPKRASGSTNETSDSKPVADKRAKAAGTKRKR
jgi:class III poly(R)-hydroxyalkanoic acid synthase PhaE subunit